MYHGSSLNPTAIAGCADWHRHRGRRQVALVNAVPASGFLGVPGNRATADARFVVDEPEHVVIETVAPERGFLFLADQYFPGWSAP